MRRNDAFIAFPLDEKVGMPGYTSSGMNPDTTGSCEDYLKSVVSKLRKPLDCLFALL